MILVENSTINGLKLRNREKKDSIYSSPFSLYCLTIMHNCIINYLLISTKNDIFFDTLILESDIMILGFINILGDIEEFLFF